MDSRHKGSERPKVQAAASVPVVSISAAAASAAAASAAAASAASASPFDKPLASRTRSTSNASSARLNSEGKRTHSVSVSSVKSSDSYSDDRIEQALKKDSRKNSAAAYGHPAPYPAAYPAAYGLKPLKPLKGKIKIMGDADLEKQMIITAGGKQEYVLGFVCKLVFLVLVVLGCSVMIFYAL